jgi:hypothetical protein
MESVANQNLIKSPAELQGGQMPIGKPMPPMGAPQVHQG